jgi:hypothetical protein
MASVKTVINAVSRWGALVGTKLMAGDHSPNYQGSIWAFRIIWAGPGVNDWTVSTAVGNATDQASKLTTVWDAPNDRLIITIPNTVDNEFSAVPAVYATPSAQTGLNVYTPLAAAFSASIIWVNFLNQSPDPAVFVDPPDAKCDFHLLIVGKIG